jgi:alpha-mannosidase
MAEKKTQVIMYHHTHWDREWWTTFQYFRFRLVNIVDRLLEILDTDPSFTCFTLDGQTIVLKDYLEVRPENREKLVGYINSGRIQVGPWHILPDEFLVDAESHIRNLWMGQRTARQYGVKTADVGYLPDQFGHIGQMPQILNGFGIDSAVVWRGFGAPPVGHAAAGVGYPGHPDCYQFPQTHNAEQYPDRMQSEFWWESPDGTKIMGIWLPLEYYRSHYADYPNDPERQYDQTIGRARRTVKHLQEFATTCFILEPMGGDHLPVDARLPRIIEKLNEELGPEGVEYRQASLRDFVNGVKSENPDFQVTWKGEGRAFGRKAHMLPGVLSARLYLKQMNQACETALERYAEPLQALNWLQGSRYEQSFLWQSWEKLIQNHPHDSICGCSVDQVHKEMETRFDESKQVADLLASTALEDIAHRVDTSFVPDGGQPFVVFNPLTWNRTDEVTVAMNAAYGIDPLSWVLKDSTGKEIPFQTREGASLIDKYERFDWLKAPSGKYTEKSANTYTEVFFVAEGVPGLGYKTYYLQPRERKLSWRVRNYTVDGVVAKEKGDLETSGLRFGPGLLENQFLKVAVSANDGSLTVTDKETGHVYTGLNTFEDGGDAGDTYNYSWPMGDQILATKGVQPKLSWVEYGAARATLRVTWSWSLPEGLTEDRESRSEAYVPFELHTDITLLPGVKRVDVKTHFSNTAKDHRLQALFPFGTRVEKSSAEGHFHVVDRPTGLPADERGSAEVAVHEHPQMTFVSVSDGNYGLTIANRGLPEFSVADDATGTVRLTVLRAVGWLSREDFLTRIGGAGPTSLVPGAQMLGPVVAEYSIIPHKGTWDEAQSFKAAHDFNATLYAATEVSQRAPMRAHIPSFERTLPAAGALVEVEGDLLLTALKRAEDREALVMRFVNESHTTRSAWVRPGRMPKKAYLVNLKEEPVADGDLAIDENGAVAVQAEPWQLVTIAFEF